MRLLVLCALSFMGGALVPNGELLALPLAACAAVAVLARHWVALAGLAAAAFCAGAWSASVAWPSATAREGVHEGVVARPPEDMPGQRRVLVDVDGGARVLVLERAPRVQLIGGERVRFVGHARPPRTPGIEGAFDRARHLAGRGVALEALAEAPGITVVDEPPRWSPWRAAGWARARAAVALAAGSSGDGAAVLQALVLGRRGDVRPELEEAFRRAGVSHVLSVSGVHLAAATFLVFALAGGLFRRSASLTARFAAERAAALAALPAALAYTLLTGAAIATLRALLCAVVVLAGKALGRTPDGQTALAAAALVLCVDAPLVVHEPSFQLSFVAAAALVLVAQRLRGRGRVVSVLGASLAATVVTAPFTALHFGVVQPGGVLANLVVVPLAELVVLPLGLLAAVVGIAGGPEVAATFAALAGFAAEALAWVVTQLARVLPSWEVPPPRRVELAALVVAAFAGIKLAWRRALVIAAICAAVVGGSLLAGVLAPRRELVVTFLDVGQGDAALVETPAGERWLIDAGGRLFGDSGADPGEDVRRMLAARRIFRLDVVMLSHPHPDHYGGLVALVGRVAVGEVWVNDDEAEDGRWDALRARLPRVVTVAAGATRVAGSARLEVLAPAAADPLRSVNDNSLVARLTFAGRSVLFTGDLEAAGEAALVRDGVAVTSDVVKVGHHGSQTSSTEPFVRAVRPSLAVVSCGRDNRFGFPAPEVVARWAASGAAVVRTDERGSITVRVTPEGELGWSSFRAGR